MDFDAVHHGQQMNTGLLKSMCIVSYATFKHAVIGNVDGELVLTCVDVTIAVRHP